MHRFTHSASFLNTTMRRRRFFVARYRARNAARLPASAVLLVAVLLVLSPVSGQTQETEASAERGLAAGESTAFTSEERVTLAISSPTYPVTPGDTYHLYYVLPSGVETSISTTVDANFEIQLGHLGSVNTEGMALRELRSRVARMVRSNYPNAYPQLDLERVGLFRVHLSGAVERAGWVEAWGLTHVSSVLQGRVSEGASRREVERKDSSGEVTTCDLVAAERLGRIEEDHFVRPGDQITVPYSERRVTIRGEVRRPGQYDLLSVEGFDDLLNWLAGGPTAQADLSNVEITSLGSSPGEPDEYRTFDYDDGSPGWLKDQDSVYVPSIRENNPVVYVSIQSGSGVSTIRHRLREGDTLLTIMKAVLLRPGRGREITDGNVSPESLSLARIQRHGRTVQRVDIEALVFGGEDSLDMGLEPRDTVVVP